MPFLLLICLLWVDFSVTFQRVKGKFFPWLLQEQNYSKTPNLISSVPSVTEMPLIHGGKSTHLIFWHCLFYILFLCINPFRYTSVISGGWINLFFHFTIYFLIYCEDFTKNTIWLEQIFYNISVLFLKYHIMRGKCMIKITEGN